MAQLPKIVFLSDIHIGSNAATNWYQRELHEPYLLAVFEHIAREASSVQELVLAGDLVDQWTYEPSRTPPTFAEIVAANPRVFGGVVDGQRIPGALGAALAALEGRVTYVIGNHDMSVTAADVSLVRDASGRSPRHFSGPLYEPPAGKGQVVCTHGHLFSLLNAPDFVGSPRTGIPFAHFITRMAALWTVQQLTRLPAGSTAASLSGGGDPTGWPLARDALVQLVQSVEQGGVSLSGVLLGALLEVTGQTSELAFDLLDGTRVTAAEVVNTYASVFQRFEDTASRSKDLYGPLAAAFALAEVDALNSVTHFAERLGVHHNYPVVVIGHTHVPVDQAEHQLFLGQCVYANCGFGCPSRPDMQALDKPRCCTFTEVEIDEAEQAFIVSTRYVTIVDGVHQVAPRPLTPAKRIAMRSAPARRPAPVA